jgi:predicted Fe-Mo cluster-binding NifX family protein
MLVAVPLFDRDVAPRFAFAESFLVADVIDGQVRGTHRTPPVPRPYADRINHLRNLGVEVILCCGIVRQFIPLAESLGIQVVSGVVGDARDALERYARNELPDRTLEPT